MKIKQLIQQEQIHYLIKWTLLSTMVGLISGVIITIYTKFVLGATQIRLSNPYLILGLPVMGYVLTKAYDKVSCGRLLGNNVLISGIKGKHENVSLFMIPFVIMSTALTHLFGASVGKEDMATELAGDVAFYVSRKWHLSRLDAQWVMISAIAAGFAGTFGTPITATVFSLEIVNRGKIRLDGLYPAFITALVTQEVTTFLGIQYATFTVQFPQMTMTVFLTLVVLSVLCGLVGHLFVSTILTVRHFGLKLMKTRANLSFVTGLIVVVIALSTKTTQYLGLSTQMQQQAFHNDALSPFAWLYKLFYCGLNIGGFYRGGATTPLFDIGASFGAMMAQWIHLPQNFISAMCLVGVFAAATNTPIACLMLGIELFHGNGAAFFFIMVIFSYVTSGKFSVFAAQKMPEYHDEDMV